MTKKTKNLVLFLVIPLLILLAAFLIVWFILPSDTFDPCDYNQDGLVDEREDLVCQRKPIVSPVEKIVDETLHRYGRGEEFITYVESEGIGDIAVLIDIPENPRYPEGAPIVFDVSTWFAGLVGFHDKFDATAIGAININHLWPGNCDPRLDVCSEGENDYGGPDSIASLRDAIRFATGLIPNTDGFYIEELLEVTPLLDNVGLYASSHSGVVATNVLAYYGSEFPTVKYFIGRENPTLPQMYPLEIGHWDEQHHPVQNPFYNPDGYAPTTIDVDYSTVCWIQNAEYPEGRPCHELANGDKYILDDKGPNMWGKRYFSAELTQALLDTGSLTLDNWPEDLATPEETVEVWPYRTAANHYSLLKKELPDDFKVMIVFSYDDHVQVALDRPHIHQAYDGFYKTAGVDWVRLNPDLVYAQQLDSSFQAGLFSDNTANTEPTDWSDSKSWGHPYNGTTIEPMSQASMAEMCDRVQFGEWSENLDEVLWSYEF
ncbi:MAG: hypothetical protein V1695_02870 [Candidatus Uhrbacteria bacterium]